MIKITSEIRQTFLNFFCSKEHKIIESSSLIPTNDNTLLFTNAGMNQFKDIFLDTTKRIYPCVSSVQRCLRAGGKHNDLENVGYTNRHHTFFEMLGNFSFGDYFKYESIHMAWELLTSTQWFGLPKEKFWITVYFTDNESYNIWTKKIGIPNDRVIRIGDNKKNMYNSDNFWYMGGNTISPCGPCSEIFYDLGEHMKGTPPGIEKKYNDRYIEIWNIVFMQFSRQINGSLIPLSNPSVDTGMGLERISSILQNVDSNYEIDIFKKLITISEKIIGVINFNKKSLHVIADHIRACVFLINDGVIPSNEGRGYVLRRIIRRAIRHGYLLNNKKIFFYKLVEPLINIMEDITNVLFIKKNFIEEILRSEEEQFIYVLNRGSSVLKKELTNVKNNMLSGDVAFKLYDTYGFPFETTKEICFERKIEIDEDGFKKNMDVQRKKSQLLSTFFNDNSNLLYNKYKTKFFGYEQSNYNGRIIALFVNGQEVNTISHGDKAIIILDQTSFYGESGGQIGDSGILKSMLGSFEVTDTQKYGQAIGHRGFVNYGKCTLGELVTTEINIVRRNLISINHSATHLLHAALRKVLGEKIIQKGSSIKENFLRFDFSYEQSMTSKQIYLAEDLVNDQIYQNISIKTEIMDLAEARKKSAVHLISKKYSDKVRVLIIGDFSIELCGGTHSKRTGEIGIFHIVKESSISFGIRRIEAITKNVLLKSVRQNDLLINDISYLLKSNKSNMVENIKKLQTNYIKLKKELNMIKKNLCKNKSY